MCFKIFLQRIVNGGGEINREYGLGMGRTDLTIPWRLPGGGFQRFVIECKVMRGSRETVIGKDIINRSDRSNFLDIKQQILIRLREISADIFGEIHEDNLCQFRFRGESLA